MTTTTRTAADTKTAATPQSGTEPTTSRGVLEHVNVTVTNPERTAATLNAIFGWEIRWQGASALGGRTVHVGEPGDGASYLALYTFDTSGSADGSSYHQPGGLNHIAVVVDDLDLTEAAVIAAGYSPHTHGDYEPGRRFYFHDHDNIEFEVVSYS